MNGLMMDYQLTLPTLLRRAETYFGDAELVTRLPDRSFHRYTYGESCRRARQLAVALQELGLERGDRVATLCWNHLEHHEAYLGIPCGGFVLHTLNLRLHPNDLAYIANARGRRAVIVDRSSCRCSSSSRTQTKIEHVFVVEDGYEELLAGADADAWPTRELDENEAAAMCYTSGTTGLPKGVLYSHRSTMLHTLGVAAGNPIGLGISRARHDPAGRADVPRERLGLPVPRDDARREARVPGAVPRPGEPARRRSCRRASRGRPACRRSGSASCSCSTRSPAAGTSRA